MLPRGDNTSRNWIREEPEHSSQMLSMEDRHTHTRSTEYRTFRSVLVRPEPLIQQVSIEYRSCARHSPQSETISEEITQKISVF